MTYYQTDLPTVSSVLKVLIIRSIFVINAVRFFVTIIKIGDKVFIFHSIERERFAAV